MPYIKPELLMTLQHAAYAAKEESIESANIDKDTLSKSMKPCPICGDYGCSKDMVKANGVFVHPEDAAEADRIDAPWR